MSRVLVIACGALFVFAAWQKSANPCPLVVSVGIRFGGAASVATINGLEGAIGVALLVSQRRAFLAGAVVLLVVFSGYLVVQAVRHGLAYQCGCIPGLDGSVLWGLVRNGAMILVLCLGMRGCRAIARAPS